MMCQRHHDFFLTLLSLLLSRHIAGAAPPRAVVRASRHHAVRPQLPHRAAHLADLQPHSLLQASDPPLQGDGRGPRLTEQRQRRQGEEGPVIWE